MDEVESNVHKALDKAVSKYMEDKESFLWEYLVSPIFIPPKNNYFKQTQYKYFEQIYLPKSLKTKQVYYNAMMLRPTKEIILNRGYIGLEKILKYLKTLEIRVFNWVIYYWTCKKCGLVDIQETCITHEEYKSCEEMRFPCPCCKKRVNVTKVQIFKKMG